MKSNYKTRMTDAKHQRMIDEQRKETLGRVRAEIAQPFGYGGESPRKLRLGLRTRRGGTLIFAT